MKARAAAWAASILFAARSLMRHIAGAPFGIVVCIAR